MALLSCQNADGASVGAPFNGTIRPARQRDAESLVPRRHPMPTHILVCQKVSPVAPGLVIVAPNGNLYTVTKPFDSGVGSPHQSLWLLLAKEIKPANGGAGG